MELNSRAHRRFDPLRREWILVSPGRTARPWQGQIEAQPPLAADPYDPACYLCPGNVRANGERNPPYASTFAFDNDFAALTAERAGPPSLAASAASFGETGSLFHSEPERGICRVVCYSPRHDLTLSQMDVRSIRSVVDAWVGECAALARVPWVRYATVFENRGAMMGTSNPHPHCQIWATEHVPNEPAREERSLAEYDAAHGRCLLCDYAAAEVARGERVVAMNDSFLVIVPFWAVWPFETLLIARRHVARMQDLDDGGRDALADILKCLTSRYDGLFGAPFPYSMGFHQALREESPTHAHLHAHFYPPLLRSATIRKFMVGFELLGSPQRDFTPEEAANRLAGVSRS